MSARKPRAKKPAARAPRSRSKKKRPQPAAKRLRLDPRSRSDQILNGAIRFFAARGFGGQTRDLASELGISTGLLYRYFPTKAALIDRIYETLFEGRWKSEWDEILGDERRDLRDRLVEFYLDYSRMLHDYEWARIYLYSGLGGAGIAQRFVRMVTDRVYSRVIGALRRKLGQPDLRSQPLTEPETELMWSLHGALFYIGVRMWIYDVGGPRDIDRTIRQLVDNFYRSAQDLMSDAPERHR